MRFPITPSQFIPIKEYKSFMADPNEAPYKKYQHGLCPIPFSTIDSASPDGDFPDVTHLKRGRGSASGSAASLSVSSCGGSASGVTFSYSNSPKKGSPTTITGRGTIGSGNVGGDFTIEGA